MTLLEDRASTTGHPQAPLTGRHVRIRPVTAEDEPYLFHLATCPENLTRWRFRGRTPSWEEFRHSLWDRTLCQFVIETKTSARPVGHVVAYRPDLDNGWVYLAILGDPQCRGLGWPLEGGRLTIDHLFANWPLRKVYVETLEFNAQTMATGLAAAGTAEARLKRHDFFDGRWWDLLVYALDREAWNTRTTTITTGSGTR